MSNIIKIYPKKEINYHIADDKIEGVSLEVRDQNLFFGIDGTFYYGKEFHSAKPKEIEELCIAYLALVNPDVLKFD